MAPLILGFTVIFRFKEFLIDGATNIWVGVIFRLKEVLNMAPLILGYVLVVMICIMLNA